MRTKWNQEKFENILLERGYTCEQLYNSVDAPITLICEHGHSWATTFYRFNHMGHNCPTCVGGVSLDSNVFMERMNTSNIKFDITQYKGMNNDIDLECAVCDYKWTSTAGRISRKPDCPSCNGKRRYSLSDVKVYLSNKGIELLDDQYVNAHKKLSVKCNVCHYGWEAPFDRLKISGCPNCATNSTVHDTIYLWNQPGTNIYKIGITTSTRGKRRINEVAAAANINYNIILFELITELAKVEEIIKKKFKHKHNPFEKENFNGHSEFLFLDEKEVQVIINLVKEYK